MTNVIVQDLGASTESRVPCRELVKKIAIYKVCVSVCVRVCVCVCVRACVGVFKGKMELSLREPCGTNE